MKQRIRRWRREQRRRLVPENVLLPAWSWRTFAICALYPSQGLRFWRLRFRLWACLPGDAFEDLQTDRTMIVRDVKPDAVTFYVFANDLLDHPDRIGLYGRRPALALERVPRPELGRLLSPDPDLVDRARALIA